MATTTTNFGWDIPQSTDLVKDGATAIAALGQDIDTALVDLKGGTTGQVLAKASGTDLDFSWVAQDDSNAIQNAIVDAKGDLIAATANDTPARLAVGTNGHVLTADSTAATGIKWAAPAAGGKVLQVIQDLSQSYTATTSTTFQATGLSVTITPSSATSKVLIIANLSGVLKGNATTADAVQIRLTRGGSSIYSLGDRQAWTNTAAYAMINAPINFLDSPASTSALTYAVEFASKVSGQSVAINYSDALAVDSTIIAMEIGA
jgi:hypothetical protein